MRSGNISRPRSTRRGDRFGSIFRLPFWLLLCRSDSKKEEIRFPHHQPPSPIPTPLLACAAVWSDLMPCHVMSCRCHAQPSCVWARVDEPRRGLCFCVCALFGEETSVKIHKTGPGNCGSKEFGKKKYQRMLNAKWRTGEYLEDQKMCSQTCMPQALIVESTLLLFLS
jgi:hypothetical protein